MYSSVMEGSLLQVRFNADLELVERLCADAGRFLSSKGLGTLDFELNLILREAVCNAIIHGSGANPARLVDVQMELDTPFIRLRVRDQGEGWNWRGHEWCPPPPDQEGGRGLFILNNYSDKVVFNDSGNEVTITKRYKAQEKSMTSTNIEERRELVMGESLSAGNLDEYRKDFKASVDSGVRELVLDCSALEVVDSMGIGLLVATHNSLNKTGGELIMINTPEPIYNLMSTMRLNRHFTVERT